MRLTLVLLILSVFTFTSCEEQLSVFPHKRVLKIGDDEKWADKNIDDSEWDRYGRTSETGIFWVRFEISFGDFVKEFKNVGVNAISIGSYEAYWDGILLNKNGKVAKEKKDEVPGKFMSEFLVPDSLAYEGKHTLAFRVSNHHNVIFKGSWNTFQVEEYGKSQKRNLRLTALMYILGGGYLIAAFYYILVFLSKQDRKQELIFGLLCLAFFGLIIAEFYKFLVPYPYHFHIFRLLAIGLLTCLIAYLVPYSLYRLLELPYRKYFSFVFPLGLITFLSFNNLARDSTNQWLSTIMLVSSFIISIVALLLKRPKSLTIMLSLLAIILINVFSQYSFNFLLFNYDINLFIGFTILVLTILYLMVQKNKARDLAYESAQLKSVRLQNELLKKNIQPHFIMNTLTSVMEWVEISPKQSIEFIEALADEFAILSKISDKKLIPITQEIDLIKRHIKVMGYRKDITYIFKANEIDEEALIPPAILHTVVENGISHSIPVNGSIRFHLNYEREGDWHLFTLNTHAKNRPARKDSSSGTGFKYIKSRLRESYGDSWQVYSHETITGWETIIKIKALA